MNEYTSTSEPQRIPCHSDFTINYRATFRGTALPLERLPFVLRIQSWGAKTYVASHNPETNEWVNCGPGETADYIRIFMHDHGLLAGELHAELHVRVPDDDYPGGSRNLCYSTHLGVELTDGCCGTCACDVNVDVVLPYAVVTAYDIAVAAGYKGTREEYLAMLAGLPEDERARIEAEKQRAAAELLRGKEIDGMLNDRGRNLLLGTARGAEGWEYDSDAVSDNATITTNTTSSDSRALFKRTAAPEGVTREVFSRAVRAGVIRAGRCYTLTVRCRTSAMFGERSLRLQAWIGDSAHTSDLTETVSFGIDMAAGDSRTLSCQLTVADDCPPEASPRICIGSQSDTMGAWATLALWECKLELGETRTAYTTAPEDNYITRGEHDASVAGTLGQADATSQQQVNNMSRTLRDEISASEVRSADLVAKSSAPRTWAAVPEAYKGNSDVTEVAIPLDTYAGESRSIASVMDGCGNARTAAIGTNMVGGVAVADATRAFFGCRNLRSITPALHGLDLREGRSPLAFYGCTALEDVRLPGWRGELNLRWSPRLSYDSLLAIIEGHAPADVGTLTLHPEVYVKLTGTTRERPEGWWTRLPTLTLYYNVVIDTPRYMFAQSFNSIVMYDKTAGEHRTLAFGDGLWGTDRTAGSITAIRHDPDGGAVYVCQSSGVIDRIDADGSIHHIELLHPDGGGRYINDIAVAQSGARLYVATDTGYTILARGADDSYAEDLSVAVDAPVQRISLLASGEVMYKAGGKIYTRSDGEAAETIEWTAPAATMFDWAELPDRRLIWAGNGEVCLGTVDADTHTITGTRLVAANGCGAASFICPAASGWYIGTSSGIALVSPDGMASYTTTPVTGLPSGWAGYSRRGAWAGLSAVWAACYIGLQCDDFSGSGAVAVVERFTPRASKCMGAYFFVPTPDGRALYYCGKRYSRSSPGWISPTQAFDANRHCPLEKFDWASRTFELVNPYFTDNGRSALISGEGFLLDPVDPSIIYFADFDHGLVVSRNGEIIARFSSDNSPIEKSWAEYMEGICFDPRGNLWITQRPCTEDGWAKQHILVHCLTADKLAKFRADPDSLRPDDWFSRRINEQFGDDYSHFIIFGHRHPDYLFLATDYQKRTAIIDTKGTAAFSDDDVHTFYASNLTANSGYAVPTYLKEDLDGQLWLGCVRSLFVIDDLADSLGKSLLQVRAPQSRWHNRSIYINGIGLAPDNTKYVATQYEGLYHLSADGTEILDHFTAVNSGLPADDVWGVYCDLNSDEVFISTPGGNYIYQPAYSGRLDAGEAARWEALAELAAQRNITITTL